MTEQPPGTGRGAGPATAAIPGSRPGATDETTTGPGGTGIPGGPLPAGPIPAGTAPRGAGGRVPPRRRRSRWRAAFFGLAGLAIIVAAAWALLGDRVLVVRSIAVTGTRLVTPAAVLGAADVPLGTPLLRVDAGAVTRRVEALRQVASATVSEGWPDHLTITVTERVPVLAVRMAAGGYDQVDPTGVVVLMTRAQPKALPVLSTTLTGSALRDSPGVAAAAGVLAELRPSLRRQVAGVSTAGIVTGAGDGAGSQQVALHLRDGVTVLWGGTDNAAAKNREVTRLLLGHVHYVDVSAPGTAVTR